jgi:ribose-phosphate pyrophosphokinase
MITTAGTVEAAAQALLDRACRPGLVVAATHGLFVGHAAARLAALPLRHVIVSDTVTTTLDIAVPVSTVGIHGVLADAITALHRGKRSGSITRPDG